MQLMQLKTKKIFVAGINCKVKDKTKERKFVKVIKRKTKVILAFHGEQSFEEGEVTPELVHEIGVRLEEEKWKKQNEKEK